MTRAKIIHWTMLAIILAICYTTIYYQNKVVSSGRMMYVPLVKEHPFTVTDEGLEINFNPLVKGIQKLQPFGSIVVYINSFGVVSFVRVDKGKDPNTLSFGEHFLNYYTYRKSGIYPDHQNKIFFGTRYLPIHDAEFKQKSSILTRARYLILKVSEAGFAIPVGLADRNYGNILHIYK